MDAALCPPLADDRTSTPGSSQHFGDLHFGTCDFGDKRLTARAVRTADALMRHPGGTLPAKLPRAQLCGFYDFANNVKVDHDNVPAAHCLRTRRQAGLCAGPVLIVHDTTDGDYSGLTIDDLGPVGKGYHHHGLLIHNVLAVDASSREALGLLGQVVQVRRKVPRNESTTASRTHPLRESRLWAKGAAAVGRPPPGATWVNLMDRGGDTFESPERQQSLGQYCVVRSCKDRVVRVTDAAGRTIRRKPHAWARRLPTPGERTVDVAANAHQVARRARVRVAAGPVRLQVPHEKCGEHGREPPDAWVVDVLERGPPGGRAPLEWILLSNVPTTTRADAWARVDWYECRPVVEEFHKAQKTGCGMEQLQFTTRKALEVTIAMVSVVAVQLLRLRDLARADDDRPARTVVDEPYVEALSLWRWKGANVDPSAREFLYALARLGGHLGRTADGLPGWLVLWRGWTELQRLVEGMLLGRLNRSGQT